MTSLANKMRDFPARGWAPVAFGANSNSLPYRSAAHLTGLRDEESTLNRDFSKARAYYETLSVTDDRFRPISNTSTISQGLSFISECSPTRGFPNPL